MKNKLIYALAFSMVIGVSSCDKLGDFDDTNVNPAATTEPNPAALLTNSLQSLGGWTTSRQLGYYAQYFSETQYPSVSLYALPQAAFTGNYSGTLYDLQNIINIGSSKNMSAISKITQQFIYWHMTDRWGDIPYSQALKGVANGSPKYDTQEEIYKGMIKALTDAVAEFDGSAISGDILYGGDVASWKRVANSLRMLMAVQLSKKYPSASGYAATEFKAALAGNGGYIASNAQNFLINYAAPNYKNPVWGWYNGRADDGESNTMTNMLTNLNDARIQIYGGNSHTGGTGTSNIGTPYGVNEATARAFVNANANWARVLRGDFRLEASPVYLVTASQIALARAEAANLGWTTESVTATYQDGISLSFTQWGLPAPSAAYFAGDEVALGTDNVRKIATQQWISAYPDGHIGWNVWRKTGFPVLTPAIHAVNTSKQIVRRFTYAVAEYNNNLVNLKPAVDRLPGGDTQDSRVWWDQ